VKNRHDAEKAVRVLRRNAPETRRRVSLHGLFIVAPIRSCQAVLSSRNGVARLAIES
jgi:hypothetical protein